MYVVGEISSLLQYIVLQNYIQGELTLKHILCCCLFISSICLAASQEEIDSKVSYYVGEVNRCVTQRHKDPDNYNYCYFGMVNTAFNQTQDEDVVFELFSQWYSEKLDSLSVVNVIDMFNKFADRTMMEQMSMSRARDECNINAYWYVFLKTQAYLEEPLPEFEYSAWAKDACEHRKDIFDIENNLPKEDEN